MPTESITELQNTLDLIRQRKAARRLLASGPQNKAPDPSTAPTIAARIAKLRSITAAAKDDLARIAAKTAPARPTAPTRPPVKASAATSRSARREAARTASMLTATTAANFTDAMLSQAATHRSSPAADREIATAELQRRGFTVSPEGIVSRSTRKD
jgi:hypothetical protein